MTNKKYSDTYEYKKDIINTYFNLIKENNNFKLYESTISKLNKLMENDNEELFETLYQIIMNSYLDVINKSDFIIQMQYNYEKKHNLKK